MADDDRRGRSETAYDGGVAGTPGHRGAGIPGVRPSRPSGIRDRRDEIADPQSSAPHRVIAVKWIRHRQAMVVPRLSYGCVVVASLPLGYPRTRRTEIRPLRVARLRSISVH